jgi:hypothetical protein
MPARSGAADGPARAPGGRNGFTIADPDDPGMLDVVGVDTATPGVISGFASGSL